MIYANALSQTVLISIFGMTTAESVLLLWAVILSSVALVMMALDKATAKLRRRRISESTLGLIALMGGFWGIILGGTIFNHKVSKPRFWIPVLAALILWTVLFLIAFGVFRI